MKTLWKYRFEFCILLCLLILLGSFLFPKFQEGGVYGIILIIMIIGIILHKLSNIAQRLEEKNQKGECS